MGYKNLNGDTAQKLMTNREQNKEQMNLNIPSQQAVTETDKWTILLLGRPPMKQKTRPIPNHLHLNKGVETTTWKCPKICNNSKPEDKFVSPLIITGCAKKHYPLQNQRKVPLKPDPQMTKKEIKKTGQRFNFAKTVGNLNEYDTT